MSNPEKRPHVARAPLPLPTQLSLDPTEMSDPREFRAVEAAKPRKPRETPSDRVALEIGMHDNRMVVVVHGAAGAELVPLEELVSLDITIRGTFRARYTRRSS